jgi:flavin reductase (DIM6/NTAB) family NADH-FMN oxidoreductase RutF
VAVAVEDRSRLIELVEGARIFAISVLARDQHHLSRHFATAGREPTSDGFDVVASYPVATGAPILVGSIAHFDCRLHSMLPGGDHRILIGEVVAAGESDGEPLLYFEGDYRELGDPSLSAESTETSSRNIRRSRR